MTVEEIIGIKKSWGHHFMSLLVYFSKKNFYFFKDIQGPYGLFCLELLTSPFTASLLSSGHSSLVSAPSTEHGFSQSNSHKTGSSGRLPGPPLAEKRLLFLHVRQSLFACAGTSLKWSRNQLQRESWLSKIYFWAVFSPLWRCWLCHPVAGFSRPNTHSRASWSLSKPNMGSIKCSAANRAHNAQHPHQEGRETLRSHVFTVPRPWRLKVICFGIILECINGARCFTRLVV